MNRVAQHRVSNRGSLYQHALPGIVCNNISLPKRRPTDCIVVRAGGPHLHTTLLVTKCAGAGRVHTNVVSYDDIAAGTVYLNAVADVSGDHIALRRRVTAYDVSSGSRVYLHAIAIASGDHSCLVGTDVVSDNQIVVTGDDGDTILAGGEYVPVRGRDATDRVAVTSCGQADTRILVGHRRHAVRVEPDPVAREQIVRAGDTNRMAVNIVDDQSADRAAVRTGIQLQPVDPQQST